MRYDQWVNLIASKIRSGEAMNEDYHANPRIGDGSGHSMYDSMSHYWIQLSDTVRARLTNNGFVAIYPNPGLLRNVKLGSPAIYVYGDVIDGKQYTFYTYQCRPGSFDRNLHSSWRSPIELRSCKIGANPLYCVKKLGEKSRTEKIDYCVPSSTTSNYPSISSVAYPWIIYDHEGNLSTELQLQSLAKPPCFEYDVKRTRTSYDRRPELVNQYIGSCKDRQEFYESIPNVMQHIKGMTGSKSTIKDTMLLAAKAHKAALEFQKHVPSAEIHLLPMRPEQEAIGDCRFSPPRDPNERIHCPVSFHINNRSVIKHTFSTTTSSLHYFGEPVAGNGCMLPSIVLTVPMSLEDCKKYIPEFYDSSKLNLSRTIVMTIPPVGLDNIGHRQNPFAITDLKLVWNNGDKGHYRDKYICVGDDVNIVHGSKRNVRKFYDREERRIRPYELISPASTLLALQDNLGKMEDSDLLCSYNTLFDSSHAGSRSKDAEALHDMTQFLFDFTNNRERVVIEYYHPGTTGTNKEYLPIATDPEEFLDGLSAEYALQSMPLC